MMPTMFEMVPKYPRTYHWPWSPQVHQDDSYHRDPAIFVGEEVVILEKLDGGNTCLARGDVYARSTGKPANEAWFGMVRKHHAHKTLDLDPDLFTYGEDLFGVHSIEYDPLPEDQTYYVFGARQADYWYGWDELVEHANKLALPTVPLVHRGVFDSVKAITKFLHSEIVKPSALGPTREGFVIRFASNFHNSQYQLLVAKYVRKNHVQTDEHWRVNWKACRLKKD